MKGNNHSENWKLGGGVHLPLIVCVQRKVFFRWEEDDTEWKRSQEGAKGTEMSNTWETWGSLPFGFLAMHVISGMRVAGCGGPDLHPSLRGSREKMTSVQEF